MRSNSSPVIIGAAPCLHSMFVDCKRNS
jgi:hypothetical protein